MAVVSEPLSKPIRAEGLTIYLQMPGPGFSCEMHEECLLTDPNASLCFVEDDKLLTQFPLREVLREGEDLLGKYLRFSVRVAQKGTVFCEAGLSPRPRGAGEGRWSPGVDDVMRFQPFPLRAKQAAVGHMLHGKGPFERGFHVSDRVTPNHVRLVCRCDDCHRCFSLRSAHAVFSETEYFYSADGQKTLILSCQDFPEMPSRFEQNRQAWQVFDEQVLSRLDTQGHRFCYFNSLRCPHCQAPYIDYARFPESRAFEFYAHFHAHVLPLHWEKTTGLSQFGSH